MTSTTKRRLVRWVLLPLAGLVVLVAAALLTISVKARRVYEGDLVALFPRGAVALVEAPKLEATGPAALQAYDALVASPLWQALTQDPDLGPHLRDVPAQVARARRDVPAQLEAAGLDLLADGIGQGCAAAVYLKDAPAADQPPVDFLVVTRVGYRVRFGGVVFPLVPTSALGLPEGIALEGTTPGWRVTTPDFHPLHVALQNGVLMVASSEATLQHAVDAAWAGALGSEGALDTDPRVKGPRDAAGDGTEPVRCWLDLDALDRATGWREAALLRSDDWAAGIVCAYLNTYQDLMLDLAGISAAAGWIGATPDGRLSVRAAMQVDPARRATALPPAVPPAPPAALDLLPAEYAVYTTLQADFQSLWQRFLQSAPREIRELHDENIAHYPWFDDMIPLLRGPVTLVLGRRGTGPALPPAAAVIGCTDPDQAWNLARSITDRYRERFAELHKDQGVPELREETLSGAGRLLYVSWSQGLPRSFKDLGMDFSPGLLVTGGAVTLVSTRELAVRLADALAGRAVRGGDDAGFRTGLLGEATPCHGGAHFDVAALSQLAQQQLTRIIENAGYPDYEAINTRLTARGLQLNTPEFNAARADEEAKARSRGQRAGQRVQATLRITPHLRSLSCRTTALPELPGYRFELLLVADLTR